MVQPLTFILGNKYQEIFSLIGTLFTFCLFILLLPTWIKFRWEKSQPWNTIGLTPPFQLENFIALVRGLFLAAFLILIVLITLFYGSWIKGFTVINFDQLLNAICLGLGVGFAEELIFRGWLLGEMVQLLGPRYGMIAQAAIFSLAHIRFKLPVHELTVLLLGLFFLGLILALRRSLDEGSLWGAIAFHGGLVGGWFLINTGAIEIAINTPTWLVGPGGIEPNPIGGLGAISTMLLILFYQRRAFDRAGRFFASTVKASSNEDSP